ncbi:S8 family serine peptidase [Rothia sp. CCM 9417]|uniref:S8 family serine peptidase n=1 Tax=Rothia sp. CCM 9417 TaxID=3402657 RepID=UPI003AD9D254
MFPLTRRAERHHKRCLLPLVLLFSLTPALPAQAEPTPPNETASYLPGDPTLTGGEHAERSVLQESRVEETTDQIIVRFTPHVAPTQQQAIAREEVEQSPLADTLQAENTREIIDGTAVIHLSHDLDAHEQKALIQELESRPDILSAEPDLRVKNIAAAHPGNPPRDPYWDQQWNMREAKVPAAWNLATGKGIIIGIADEGTRYHPDLTPQEIPGYDFVSRDYSKDGDGWDPDPTDPGDWYPGSYSLWHGIHVAGIAAAKTSNGIGIAGVAPDAKIQHTRVMGQYGRSYISDYAAGLMWSAGVPVKGAPPNPTPADVVNFSEAINMGTCPQILQDAINRAAARNVPIVISAGNSAINAAGATPANCSGGIVVGATGKGKIMAGYSNWGHRLDILAPGGASNGSVISTYNSGPTDPGGPSYGYLSGTSMAAPHVSGTIALMKERNPSLTIEQIRSILRTKNGGWIKGYPFLNTAAAVEAAGSGYSLIGAIGAHYYATGGQAVYGKPTGNEFPTRLGGAVQNFARSRTIYWTEATGAHTIFWPGAIGARFRQAHYEWGYGYPTIDEEPIGHGAKQHFRNGNSYTAVFWSPQTGAHSMNHRGGLYYKWVESGHVYGYGFPTIDETAFGDGAKLYFRNGNTYTATYWSPYTGSHALNHRGAIFALWVAKGHIDSYGFPATDELALPGGAVTYFRHRKGTETAIFWSPQTGAHSLNSTGAIYYHWLHNGYTTGYGFPLENEGPAVNGVVSVKFSGGKTINWSAKRGIWES